MSVDIPSTVLEDSPIPVKSKTFGVAQDEDHISQFFQCERRDRCSAREGKLFSGVYSTRARLKMLENGDSEFCLEDEKYPGAQTSW